MGTERLRDLRVWRQKRERRDNTCRYSTAVYTVVIKNQSNNWQAYV